MNRNEFLFDDISRVLGSSVPRRQALRLVAGGIGGVILGAAWPSRFAFAAPLDFCTKDCRPFNDDDCPSTKCKCCPTDVPGKFSCFECVVDGNPCAKVPARSCTCCNHPCSECDAKTQKCTPLCLPPKTLCCKNTTGKHPVKGQCCDPARSMCCSIDGKCCDTVCQSCVTERGFKVCKDKCPPKGFPKDTDCCINESTTPPSFGACCDPKFVCCDTATGNCCDKPKAYISSVQGGPPTQIRMTFQEATKGLATVSVVKAINVSVNIPSFVPGTKHPVVATLTKVNQTEPAHFTLKGCSTCPCCANGEPVVTTLKLNTGRWARQRFANIGEAEYFVTVRNGHLGLRELTVQMNGKPFELRKLRDGEMRDLNVSSAMVKGGHNVVILTGRGEVGASATIMISDTKVEAGHHAKIVEDVRGAALGPQIERLRAHQNLVWGELDEETEETSHLAFAESEGQTAHVTFGGRMDIRSVSDGMHYEVEVNGRPLRVENVEPYVDSDNITITLRLAGRELRSGDKVSVFWDGLLTESGYLVSGHVGPLVVRSLQ
jgi:hypothetical protein